MSTQYLRFCSLVVGDPSGDGIELSTLRVKFVIDKSDTQSPASATIRVYNLSDDTARKIQNEFTNVFLQAGYEDNYALIFQGSVRQFRRGRENQTDTYLDIIAQDGDEGYNFSTVNTTLAAGWDQNALLGQLMQAFDPFGITAGYTPVFSGPVMPRAKVCYGMTRDHMRTLADGAGTSWNIVDGAINMVPLAGTLPLQAVVLTADTGMIGMPQQTIDGIVAKCLINPLIKHGGAIRLDNASIQTASFSVAYSAINQFPSIDNDGDYKVYAIKMTGDTRGNEWYMDLICVSISGTSPLAGPYVNATASSTGF
jgi:hypothetical protein